MIFRISPITLGFCCLFTRDTLLTVGASPFISSFIRVVISSKIRLYAAQCGSTPSRNPPVGAIALYGHPPLQYVIWAQSLHAVSTYSLNASIRLPAWLAIRLSIDGASRTWPITHSGIPINR